ncbi:MAG: glycosyltransferase family 2 protein [Chloroflexi bacterium]|nr:glycosyltransferase family 2 protein [Chloroflexota bacterium]
MKIAAVVLTKNEARHIADCLATLAWADERVVFDSFSDDATVDIARASGARVIQHAFRGYASQRNAALEQVAADWIFFVDADERATPELGAEIRQVVHRPEVGWWVPRKNIIWGKHIRHTGWSPDYQMRLLKRGFARYDPAREVHEVGLLDGGEGYLRNPLTHYNYDTVRQFLQKQGRYTEYEARILLESGVVPRARGLVGQPLREFWRRFVQLQGYKDGGHGLLLSVLMAYYAFRRVQMARRIARGR